MWTVSLSLIKSEAGNYLRKKIRELLRFKFYEIFIGNLLNDQSRIGNLCFSSICSLDRKKSLHFLKRADLLRGLTRTKNRKCNYSLSCSYSHYFFLRILSHKYILRFIFLFIFSHRLTHIH